MNTKTVTYIATSFFAVKAFIVPFVNSFPKDYDIHIIANFKSGEIDSIKCLVPLSVNFHNIGIARKPDIVRDLRALFNIIYLFLKIQPAVVHTLMPKAGLLGMVAAAVCRVPVRLHTFTGQTWSNSRGFKRWFLVFIDKIIVKSATNVFCDGFGQRRFLVQNNVVKSIDDIIVLGNGSVVGFDSGSLDGYESHSTNQELRDRYNIRDDDFVISHIARMTADKGLIVVLEAFQALRKVAPRSRLLLIGPDEQSLIRQMRIADIDGVIVESYVQDVRPYLAASDAFVLPRFREGFPMTLLSALCLDRPCFVSDIYGNNDLIRHGENGFLHQPGDALELADQLLNFMSGKSGQLDVSKAEVARALFSRDLVLSEYQALLDKFIQFEKMKIGVSFESCG